MKRRLITAVVALVIGIAIPVLLLKSIANDSFEAENSTYESTTQVLENPSNQSLATFAGGCFWCVEAAFEEVPGVSAVISGYTGGKEASPNYRQVASGATGHTEAVQVHYDSSVITYEGLLEVLWRTANPTDIKGQYVDRGRQYRPEIFFHNERQQQAAIKSKQNLIDSGRYDDPVVIAITEASKFYPAEEYHQDYYKKNPVRYKFYTRNSGRYQFIDGVWPEGRKVDFSKFRPAKTDTMMEKDTDQNSGKPNEEFDVSQFVKPSDEELRQTLSKLEYHVTQKDGTERPFANALHDEKRAGLYVDIVSGEPLFSSTDKFNSGTGWPSFTRPISDGVLIEKTDRSLLSVRTEIRSAVADSHLGHVFADGPAPTGLRYCMNSASMRFIPVEQMLKSGYGAYINRVTSGKDSINAGPLSQVNLAE